MNKYIRYSGEFLSRRNVCWRVDLYQEAPAPFNVVGSLAFEADEALVIEWENRSKDKVICGSTATIRIESPGDRTYEDLYTVQPGSVRMDVYRDNLLYWSGTLDPEFYEEPYEQLAHYTVNLTFSDFGILGRLKYDLAGMRTLREVVDYSLERASVVTHVDESLISTQLTADAEAMGLADIKVRSDNFYDEDGEASTLEDVLTGILQPLALRMIQRNGKVYVYDLNGLYHQGTAQPVVWSGDGSTMGVDAVYNNAKVTWSTYAQSGNLMPKTCWTESTDKQLHAMNMLNGRTWGNSTVFSYYYSQNLADWCDATDAGFSLWLSKQGLNAELKQEGCQFFKIIPQYDGQESEGIAVCWPGVEGYRISGSGYLHESLRFKNYGIPNGLLAGTLSTIGAPLFKSVSVWVPPIDNQRDLLLRISMNLLMDPRFNPFEGAVNWMKGLEQKDWQSQWNARGNFVYVPVAIKFQPDGSDAVYCWDNRAVVATNVKYGMATLIDSYGSWQKYSETSDGKPNVWGYLCWYKSDDRAEKSGVAGGWAKNRPAINPHTNKIVSVLQHCEDGQFIPYPMQGGGGGRLWVEVLTRGWQISDGGVNLSATELQNPYSLWGKYNWLLLQLPEIEIVNNVQFDAVINTDDVEYKAELNVSAKEGIEINTICGTARAGVPTARGAYFDAAAGNQIKELTRAGRTTQAEELLIGTLYSQFAGRRTKLSGEVEMLAEGIDTYTEQNQEGKLFLLTADVQDVIAHTSEVTLVELRPDEYKAENE